MSYGFTKVPNMWRHQLREVKARGTTYHVAMIILDKARWAEWVTLSNGAAGVDRRTKYYALKQLRDAGLVIVEERGRKSPRIKAMFRE
jgi:DNA-binding transcriptional ArsR family regulator